MFDRLRRWLNPQSVTYTPPPAPKGRRGPAVTTTTQHKTLEINIFNWHRSGGTAHPARPPRQPGRSLLDLRVFDRLFGPRPPAPPSVARVQAANRRT